MNLKRSHNRSTKKTGSNGPTSWGHVAHWYNELVFEREGTYQKEVLAPNLLRLLALRGGERLLDLGCGPGYFTELFAARGAEVTGVDASAELIAYAKRNSGVRSEWYVAEADHLPFVKNGTVDIVTIILAIQNMERMAAVFKEAARVLVPRGRLCFVLTHPAFRVPKASGWGWDPARGLAYRQVERYLSELKIPIDMHPSMNEKEYTLTFHRPLQSYMKALKKCGFAITAIEEWNSHKKSEPGPRAAAEDRARKEIPLFLFMEAVKLNY